MSGSNGVGRVELVARFTARPGREEEVSRLLLALTANVRNEPGCLAFDPYRVAGPPAGSAVSAGPEPVGTRFVVVEAYRDEAAFAEHLAAPYGAEFNAALGPLIEEDGSVLTFLAPLAPLAPLTPLAPLAPPASLAPLAPPASLAPPAPLS